MKCLFIVFLCILFIPCSLIANIINVPGDQPWIQAGIDAAVNGDTVLVADGLYIENINFKGKAITVASHYLTTDSTSHISNTIIDGSIPVNPDSGSVVYFISGEDTNSVLCGFTITGGIGTSWTSASQLLYRLGGGVYCSGVSGAKIVNNYIIENCISGEYAAGAGIDFSGNNGFLILERNHISNNYASVTLGRVSGGAVAIHGNGIYAHIVNNFFERDTLISNGNSATSGAILIQGMSSLVGAFIEGNVFRENFVDVTMGDGAAGGIYCMNTDVLEIRNNLFENNTAKGNAVAQGGALIIDNNLINSNENKLVADNRFINNKAIAENGTITSGGAIEVFNTIATVTGNYFKGNSLTGGIGWGGAIRTYRSAFKIENNIFADNISKSGAAIYVYGTPQTGSGQDIINNTIINNTALSSGGGVAVSGTSVNVVNSIFWGNLPNQLADTSGGSVVVRYSDIQDTLWPGEGNINTNPLFIPGDSLYNLSDSSLCIGAGINSIQIGGIWYYAPSLDFDGDPRPMPAGSIPDIGAQENPLANPIDGIFAIDHEIPNKFELNQNYPNPFNPTTTVEFSIPKTELVTLKIYNLLGQEVEELVAKRLTPGNYKYTWDAKSLASGVYVYKFQAGLYQNVRKMIYLK